jgi:TRAP-type C4-dicarboxylate transport system substrate-binding protein
VWDRISPKNQQIILNISKNEHHRIIEAVRKDDETSLALLKKAGITIVEYNQNNEEEKKYIFDTAKKVRENLVGKLYPRELLDKTLGLIDEYRKTHPGSKPDAILTNGPALAEPKGGGPQKTKKKI